MKKHRIVCDKRFGTLAACAGAVLWMACAAWAPAVDDASQAEAGEAKLDGMIEDFEKELIKVSDSKSGWESNGGQFSTATINRSADAKNGVGAGQMVFEVKSGGWALLQKKLEGADWLNRGPKAISFWVKGSGGGKMTVELEESYAFKWRKEVPLTDTNWHQVRIKFSDFVCTEKPAMSPADLVVLKFVCFDGSCKATVDDIQVEFSE